MELEIVYKHWWSYLLRATLAIIFAILLLAYPGATLKTFMYIFAILLLIQGVVDVIRSIMLASRKEKWGWTLGGAFICLLIAAIILAHTEFTLAFVAILVGIWAIIMGIVELAVAFDLPPETGRGFLAVLGVITIGIGVVVVVYPYGSVYALMVVLAIYLFVVAALDVAFSVYAWKLHKGVKKAVEEA